MLFLGQFENCADYNFQNTYRIETKKVYICFSCKSEALQSSADPTVPFSATPQPAQVQQHFTGMLRGAPRRSTIFWEKPPPRPDVLPGNPDAFNSCVVPYTVHEKIISLSETVLHVFYRAPMSFWPVYSRSPAAKFKILEMFAGGRENLRFGP